MKSEKWTVSHRELDSEPASDATWAKHNGCTGPLVQPRNYTATYLSRDGEFQIVHTTAIYRRYEGCPATAPVEWCAPSPSPPLAAD